MPPRRITFDFLTFAKSITIELDERRNQGLCDAVWGHLPYASIETHTVVSGHNIYHQIPIVSPFFVEGDDFVKRTEAPVGTVFLPDVQSLFFKYGEVSEQNEHPPIGRVIPEDLPILLEVGKRCWEAIYRTKEPVIIVARREGEPATLEDVPYRLIDPTTVSHPVFRRLITDINAEITRIWTRPPPSVLEMFAGSVDTRPGSYGQFLSGLMIMAGEVRTLTGIATCGGLLRACQDPHTDLRVLKIMTKNLMHMPTEFLGYCGLSAVWRFAKVLFDQWDALTTKDEYFAVLSSYATYINQLNIWVLHYFPWDIGDDDRFKYATSTPRTGCAP
ncbi:MAG: hypothetical protein AAGF11_17120 [Myxococcota bacterium]